MLAKSATNPPQQLSPHEVERMRAASPETNPCEGKVIWSPTKSLWFSGHFLVALIGGTLTFQWDAAICAFFLTVATLCLGHSIGLHRLLVHRSFECSRIVEYILVHLGTVVGMGGPFRILFAHDIRDWSQRQPRCHPFFIDARPFWRDLFWQLHCEMKLKHPPEFSIEPRVASDPFYRLLQRTSMLQQLPWALLLFTLGGWTYVIWAISVRVTISLIGHSAVGYLAHNHGHRDWQLVGHAVQGYNLAFLSLLTMGESWHNNHHAFPGSARLGIQWHQLDPGWWALSIMKSLGLVWHMKQPADLPERAELMAMSG